MTDRHDAGAELPPPPMTGRAEAEGSAALPWVTPVWCAGAGLVAGVVSVAQFAGASGVSPSILFMTVAPACLAGGLLGLGAMMSDRMAPGIPRWLRWGLGMGVARGLVPLATVLSVWPPFWPLSLYVPGQVVAEMVAMGIVSAAFGLWLGRAADGRRGRLWKGALIGFVVDVGGILVAWPSCADGPGGESI